MSASAFEKIIESNWVKPTFVPDLVSVIIPSYNRAEMLKESISSVFNQTYRPIECVVVDDGSTDDTAEIVECLKSNYDTDLFLIKYVYQNNSGSQVARNKGTMSSFGEFIQYLDSDDTLLATKVQMQVDYLRSNPNVDGVYGDWRVGVADNYKLILGKESNDLITQFLGDRCIANFSFLMTRSAVSRIGLWDVELKRNQEIDYHIRGLLVGCQFRYQSGETGLWRIHASERIANTTGLKQILVFCAKQVQLLETSGQNSIERSRALGSRLFYNVISSIQGNLEDPKTIIDALLVCEKLNPQHPNFNTFKMRLLKFLLGKRVAMKLWYGRVSS